MSEHHNKNGIRTDATKPEGTDVPTPVDEVAAPAPFGAIRAYPSNPFQTSELPPPKSAIVEVLAGAILGLPAGAIVGGNMLGNTTGSVLGLFLGTLFGALDGLWVANVWGRTGKLTPLALLFALVRLPFLTAATILFPRATLMETMRRDMEER